MQAIIQAIESISSLIGLSCVLNKWITVIDSLVMWLQCNQPQCQTNPRDA